MKKLSLLLVLFAALVVFVPTHAHAAAKKPESFCDNVASHPDFGEGDTGNDLWSIGCHDGYQGAQHAPPKPESFCDNVASHPDFGEGDTGNDLWSIGCHDGYQGAQPATVSNPPGPGSTVSPLPDNDIKLVNPLGKNANGTDKSLIDILQSIFKAMRTIMYVVVPIFVVVGAFQMMLAEGNPENFKKGQKTILYSVIGLIIIIMATGVVALVKSILTV